MLGPSLRSPARREPCGRDTIGTPFLVSLDTSIGYIEAHIPTRGEVKRRWPANSHPDSDLLGRFEIAATSFLDFHDIVWGRNVGGHWEWQSAHQLDNLSPQLR